MADGLPDLVDCALLAEQGAAVERVYEFGGLGRVQDLLQTPRGTLRANFTFRKAPSGRPGAVVRVAGTPDLRCQRCMQGFERRTTGVSEVEFADGGDEQPSMAEHEVYATRGGLVSLRDLAEEELLLALPMAPACDSPRTCGRAAEATGAGNFAAAAEVRRPFSALQDLLKKT